MQYQLTDPNATQALAPRDHPLSARDLMSTACQVARGMDYLAQKKVDLLLPDAHSRCAGEMVEGWCSRLGKQEPKVFVGSDKMSLGVFVQQCRNYNLSTNKSTHCVFDTYIFS